MKNIVCPVSFEKVHENIPRVTAFFVVTLLLSYILTGYILIVLFLMLDFFIRGFNYSKYSLVNHLAKPIADNLSVPGILIDKAPKLFAARLGGVFALFISFFYFIQFEIISSILALVVAIFAALECFFNICVGCYIYSWFILPFMKKQSKQL
jgi:hypothetical protein